MDAPPNAPPLEIRPARANDQLAIRTLVRGEHLNPIDLDWRRFRVAIDADGLAGAVQLRKHGDGSRELGSLVVRPDARHRGIASPMIDALLSGESARVITITRPAFIGYWARWGFRRIEADAAPVSIWRNYILGGLAGGLLSLLMGRRPSKLVVLDRYARIAPLSDRRDVPAFAFPRASVC